MTTDARLGLAHGDPMQAAVIAAVNAWMEQLAPHIIRETQREIFCMMGSAVVRLFPKNQDVVMRAMATCIQDFGLEFRLPTVEIDCSGTSRGAANGAMCMQADPSKLLVSSDMPALRGIDRQRPEQPVVRMSLYLPDRVVRTRLVKDAAGETVGTDSRTEALQPAASHRPRP